MQLHFELNKRAEITRYRKKQTTRNVPLNRFRRFQVRKKVCVTF